MNTNTRYPLTPVQCYCLLSPANCIMPRFARYYSRDVKKDACSQFDREWAELREKGYRVIKCVLRER